MVHEFDGEGLAIDTQLSWKEHGEVPVVVIKGEDEAESLNDMAGTWNVSAPEDRTEVLTDHSLEVDTSLGTLATYNFTESEEGLSVDSFLTESEVVTANEDSGQTAGASGSLRSLVPHTEHLPIERDATGASSDPQMDTSEDPPEKEAHVDVDAVEADDSESASAQETTDDIPPTKPPHTTGITDSGDEEPEKEADHQQSPESDIAKPSREPKDIAIVDAIIDYEAAARELSKRPTSASIWVEACVSTLNEPEGTNTARVAYSIGQDHNTLRTAMSGMAALGLASETGHVAPDNPPGTEGSALGRPTREFRPEPPLERFVHDYNDLRLKILSENLPEQLQDRTPAQLEQQALTTYASAHWERLGPELPLTLESVAARLGINREAVRYYAFNSFTAAYPGATQIVSYEFGREIKSRRQQLQNKAELQADKLREMHDKA